MNNIRILRLERNMTQLQVQMATGIDQPLLSKYENGERVPTVENLIILADFFHTSMDYLMNRTDKREIECIED